MTSITQQTFDFDMATLNRCVDRLKPKRLKTVFRGLLFAAAHQPFLVTDIDSDGFLIMTASINVVASWAGVTDRAVQINLDALRESHPGLLVQSSTVNTSSEWMFNLKSVLPDSSVDWFKDLVETSKVHPGDKKSSPRTFAAEVHPEKSSPRTFGAEVHPKRAEVRGELSKPTSICFLRSLAGWQAVAEKLISLGIAARARGESIEDFECDAAVLENTAALEVLVESLASDESDRRWVMLAAAIARDKNMPWCWFRKAIAHSYELRPNRSQIAFAATLQRASRNCDATELMPRMTAEQAWQKLRTTMAKIDFLYAPDEFRKALGPELHAAARATGIAKIAASNPAYQREIMEAFAGNWNDAALAQAVR